MTASVVVILPAKRKRKCSQCSIRSSSCQCCGTIETGIPKGEIKTTVDHSRTKTVLLNRITMQASETCD